MSAEIMKGLQFLVDRARKASEMIKDHEGTVRVVSHYDADGICSAAIMTKAFLRENKRFHVSFVKQLSGKFLEELGREGSGLFVFTDMGSGFLKEIAEHVKGDVIICDHHQVQGDVVERITHISSVEAGISENISGAGVAYILARTLDGSNVDLAPLAIVGAVGDSQIDAIGKDWGLNGLNREILREAESAGKLKILKGLRLWGRYTRPLHKALSYSIDPYIPGVSGSESHAVQFLQENKIPLKKDNGDWRMVADLSEEEQKRLATGIIKERIREGHEDPEHIFGDVYELLDKKEEFRDAGEFATKLNACGKMGRADLGVRVCLNDEKAYGEVRDMAEKYRREIGKSVSWLYSNKGNSGVVNDRNGVYVFAGPAISEHIISNVMSIASHSGVFPEKLIVGFADADDGSKISARAPDSLVESGIFVNEILSRAASQLGGQGGGHNGAGGATIPLGKELEFMELIESALSVKPPANRNEGPEKLKKDVNNKIDIPTEAKGPAEPKILTDDYGNEEQAESEGRGEGDKDGLQGSRGFGRGEAGSPKKVEGKGLVQYFGPR